ncbi:hypothetical protein M8A51_06505 [Schlegelella sp. S2-27]|uniref:Outer membrane protein beta-barrel domain-containing protein n=1 Tax=Caldimonas mangrovi TaxID=2944811 RepID=A0ABT0YKB5_9BURK|nr:hypothetical protein [Caldimonas mangrovi]MCM5679180.1 hypothetical protein [Caldimonas mangrovi]
MAASGRRHQPTPTRQWCGERAAEGLRGVLRCCVTGLAVAGALQAQADDEPPLDGVDAVVASADAGSGWSSGPVAVELPPAPADWHDGTPGTAGARHVGYGWTLRRGHNSITVSLGATEYRVPLDAEAPAGEATLTVLPSVQLGWYRRLSDHAGVYAATEALNRRNDGGVISVRRARLGFEWSPFKGSRLGIAHGGLRIKFDDQSRMLLKVRRSSFAAYWQARF